MFKWRSELRTGINIWFLMIKCKHLSVFVFVTERKREEKEVAAKRERKIRVKKHEELNFKERECLRYLF